MALENAPTKTWELNIYEINRRPQEAITDNTLVAVSPRSLQSELMCPICLDILKNTMTTKECLHRFCQVCIITALRSGNKECPTCRKKLVSKRSLRADPNFDSLIAKIFPHREEYEAAQEKALERINRQCSAPAGTATQNHGPVTCAGNTTTTTTTAASLSSTVSSPLDSRPSFPLHSDAESVAESGCEELLSGALARRSRVNSEAGSAVETNSLGGSSSIFSLDPPPQHNALFVPSASTSGRTSTSDNLHHGPSIDHVDMELVMRMLPENVANTRRYVGKGEQARYLRCPASTTIGHLCQYLSIRNEDPVGELQFCPDFEISFSKYFLSFA